MRRFLFVFLLLTAFATASDFVSTDFWEAMAWKQKSATDKRLLNDPAFQEIEKRYYKFVKRAARGERGVSTIPQIIHFIWLGSDLPEEVVIAVNSWKYHHPHWEINVWRDCDLENFQWTTSRAEKNFKDAPTYAEKADILRCEILYQFGGIYSDTDVICFKPFDDLIHQGLQFFAGIEVNRVSRITKLPLHVGNAIMGAAPKSQIMKYCMDHHKGIEEAPEEHILNRTGPGLCSLACIHFLLSDASENILLLPVSYFYPFPFEQRQQPIETIVNYARPETMAIHLWSGSWLSYSYDSPEAKRQKELFQ